MLKYMLIFGSALVIAAGIIPFLMRVATRWGFMDHPDIRKIHKRPIPLLGGVGIYLGCMVALFLFDRFYIPQIVSVPGLIKKIRGQWGAYKKLAQVLRLEKIDEADWQ